jgi:glutamate-1-semialdehyde 2,1-aminomutase
MTALGRRLANGLVAIGGSHGVEVQITGPLTIPTMTIGGDDGHALMSTFAEEMARQGTFVHPAHNWFLSNAHSEADIDATVEHAEAAFARLPALARS